MHNHNDQEIETMITAIVERLATMTGGKIRPQHKYSTLIELDHPTVNAGQWLRVRYNRYSKSANGVEVEYSPGYDMGRSRTYTKIDDAKLKKIAKLFIGNYAEKVRRAQAQEEQHAARMVRKTRRTELLARILRKTDDVRDCGYSERVEVKNLGVNLYLRTQHDHMQLMFEGREDEVQLVLDAIREIKELV